MKQILTIVLLLAFFTPAKAQKIHFSDKSNRWRYEFGDEGGPIHYYYSYVDTTVIIDTLSYKLMIANGVHYYGTSAYSPQKILIREDTAVGIVYAKVLQTLQHMEVDTFEHVLYNYNWKKNDTVNNSSPYTGYNFINYVEKVDTVLVGSVMHKTFHLAPASTNGGDPYTVIEGIGCDKGVIFPLFPYVFEASERLYCFYNNGTRPPVNPKVDGFFDNNTSCLLSVQDREAEQKVLRVYPQPAISTVNIRLPEKSTGQITLYNITGQKMKEQTFINAEKLIIDVGNIPRGLLFYRLETTGNGLFTGKLLLQ